MAPVGKWYSWYSWYCDGLQRIMWAGYTWYQWPSQYLWYCGAAQARHSGLYLNLYHIS
jgi:hypothetical protein